MSEPKPKSGGYIRIVITAETLRRPAVERAVNALLKAMQKEK